MKKIFNVLVLLIATIMLLTSCTKPDEPVPDNKNAVNDLWVNIPGIKDLIYRATFNEKRDTAYIDVPYFYPEGSDNEIDLTRMLLRANLSPQASISPSLGLIDLSDKAIFTVRAGTGGEKKITVVVRKVANTLLKSAKLTFTVDNVEKQSEGIVTGNSIVFLVVPGTDLSNAILTLEHDKHSTSSVPTGSRLDILKTQVITITGIDGSKRIYSIKAQEPTKLNYGFGLTRFLWKKGSSELSFGVHTETSIAVSGDYLVLVSNTSPSKYRLLNRFTGSYIQDMQNPEVAGYRSFQLSGDLEGHLLSCNFAASNGKFYLFRYKNALDPKPEKLVEWTNTAVKDGVGRRMRIYGNVSKNAVVMVTGARQNVVLKWFIVDGVVKSQNPEVSTYASVVGGTNWGYLVDAQPVSDEVNANYIINYNAEIALVDGRTNNRITAFSSSAVDQIFHAPSTYFKFNNASYFGMVEYKGILEKVMISIFDITDLGKVPLSASNPDFGKFKVFTSDVITGSGNANGTADIAVVVSEDKKVADVYILLTNGGIMAYQLTAYSAQ